jgi:hypothetical protein
MVKHEAQSQSLQKLQQANDMIARVEAEMYDLLQLRQQQHNQQQAQLDMLHQQLSSLRAAMHQGDEPGSPDVEQLTEFRAACKSIMGDVSSEFERVRSDVRRWVAQLANLQHSLQHVSLPPAGANGSDNGYEHSLPLPAAERPAAAQQDETRVLIEGVASFVLALALMNRIEAIPGIGETLLCCYQEMTLAVAVRYERGARLEQLLQQHFGPELQILARHDEQLTLFHHP